MSGGEVAALLVAAALVFLMGVATIPLLRLSRAIDRATQMVADVSDRTAPVLDDAALAVRDAGAELAEARSVSAAARAAGESLQEASASVNVVAAVLSSTVAAPLVRLGSFSYGLRYAMASRRERRRAADPVPVEVRAELAAKRAAVRAARREVRRISRPTRASERPAVPVPSAARLTTRTEEPVRRKELAR